MSCLISSQRPENFAHQTALTRSEMEPQYFLEKAGLVMEKICCLCRNMHAAAKFRLLPCMLSHCASSCIGVSPCQLPHAIEVQPRSTLHLGSWVFWPRTFRVDRTSPRRVH